MIGRVSPGKQEVQDAGAGRGDALRGRCSTTGAAGAAASSSVASSPVRSVFIAQIQDQLQVDAMHRMRDSANEPGTVGVARGQKYFDFQYGTTDEERIQNLYLEFGKTPVEIEGAAEIEKRFVTPSFIQRYKDFDTMRYTVLSLQNQLDLYRLPRNIANSTGLTKIDIRNCSLQSLPSSMGALTQLTFLQCYKCQVMSLPEEVKTLTALKTFSFACNKLKTLPAALCCLIHLEELALSDNQLSALPDIANLTKLEDLDLRDNQITALPSSFYAMASLKSLRLGNNPLNTLPDLTLFVNLELLSCINNQLRHLPTGLDQCVKLKTFLGGGNQLNDKSHNVQKLLKCAALEELHLDYNQFTGLKKYNWSALTKLKKINASHNQITRDGLFSISQMPASLESIDYSYNPTLVCSLVGDWTKLTKLTEVNLRGCGIEGWSATLHSQSVNVDLRDNDLQSVPVYRYGRSGELRKGDVGYPVEISGNPEMEGCVII